MTPTPPPRLSTKARPWLSLFDSFLRTRPFRPRRWLGNPHLQTLVTNSMKRDFSWGWRHCEQRLLELEDDSRIRVVTVKGRKDAPTLIIAHGMAGSSDSTYMQGLSHKAYRQGWNTVLLNLYNENLRRVPPRIFHAGASRQLEAIIRKLVASRISRDLVLIGVSMGANMVLKMLGEWGSNPPLSVRAAAVLSPLVDLYTSSQLMEKLSNRIYQNHFVKGLKGVLQGPQSYWENFADVTSVLRARSIREFDESFTAPVCGFRDADDYYRKASAAPLLARIRIPTLIIHSFDDPFLPYEPFVQEEVQQNPHLLLSLTCKGGHVGFLEKDRQQDIDRLWAENRMIDYVRFALSREPFPEVSG